MSRLGTRLKMQGFGLCSLSFGIWPKTFRFSPRTALHFFLELELEIRLLIFVYLLIFYFGLVSLCLKLVMLMIYYRTC